MEAAGASLAGAADGAADGASALGAADVSEPVVADGVAELLLQAATMSAAETATIIQRVE